MRSTLAGLRNLAVPWGVPPTAAAMEILTDPPPEIATVKGRPYIGGVIWRFQNTPADIRYHFYAMYGPPNIIYRGSYDLIHGVRIYETVIVDPTTNDTLEWGDPDGLVAETMYFSAVNLQLINGSTITGLPATPFPTLGLSGLLGVSNGTYVGGLGTGSGEVYANRNVSAVLPNGHLCLISFEGICNGSVANTQLGLRIRNGITVAGTQYGSGHSFMPTNGFDYEFFCRTWMVGDGLSHTFGLTAQNLTGGSINMKQAAVSFTLNGIFDFGPATNITVV